MNSTDYKALLEQIKKDLGNSILPIGCIMTFPSKNVPQGFLPCDGRELPIAQYPELYSVIKNTFDTEGNDLSLLQMFKKGIAYSNSRKSRTSFHIPDLRGQFVRGWDEDHDVDCDDIRKFGQKQDDAFQGHAHEIDIKKSTTSEAGAHVHSIYYYNNPLYYGKNTFNDDYKSDIIRNFVSYDKYYEENYGEYNCMKDYYNSLSVGCGAHVHKLPPMSVKNPISSTYNDVGNHISTETRPKNIALMFCIKVK